MSTKRKKVHPLRVWRLKNGLSLDAMAEQIGSSGAQISRIETGVRLPTPRMTLELEELTGIKRWHFRPDLWEPRR